MDKTVQPSTLHSRLSALETQIATSTDRLAYLLATGHPDDAESENTRLETLRQDAASLKTHLAPKP